MKIKIKTTRQKTISLENFLRENNILIWLNKHHCPPPHGVIYLVETKPFLCVKHGEGAHTGHDGVGKYADLAMRKFVESISDKEVTLDCGETYFSCPKLEWDGILRIKVKATK